MTSTEKTPPDGAWLLSCLGPCYSAWAELLMVLSSTAPEAKQEWKYYGDKYGWQLKFAVKKKSLIYMIPHEGFFTAALALSDSAVARLRATGLPEEIVQEIEGGRRLPEGRAARVEVRAVDDVSVVRLLVLAALG